MVPDFESPPHTLFSYLPYATETQSERSMLAIVASMGRNSKNTDDDDDD